MASSHTKIGHGPGECKRPGAGAARRSQPQRSPLMRLRLTWLACVAGMVLVLAGCQRLHHEKSWDLKPGDVNYLEVVDAPRSDQKVDVQVTATAPVDVYVVKEEQ